MVNNYSLKLVDIFVKNAYNSHCPEGKTRLIVILGKVVHRVGFNELCKFIWKFAAAFARKNIFNCFFKFKKPDTTSLKFSIQIYELVLSVILVKISVVNFLFTFNVLCEY